MSVAGFISDSMLLLAQGRHESAMCLAMNALDATASQEYPSLSGHGKVGERFTQFVRDHYDFITAVGTDRAIYAQPGAKVRLRDPMGSMNSLEDILYTVMRCYLTHETELPGGTFFNEATVYGETEQGFSIPVAMIYAVILAVVGAKTNGSETSSPEAGLIIWNNKIPVAECWGRKDKILSLLGMPTGTGNPI